MIPRFQRVAPGKAPLASEWDRICRIVESLCRMGSDGRVLLITQDSLGRTRFELAPASAATAGIVTTGEQEFTGDKTFVENVFFTGDEVTFTSVNIDITSGTVDVTNVDIDYINTDITYDVDSSIDIDCVINVTGGQLLIPTSTPGTPALGDIWISGGDLYYYDGSSSVNVTDAGSNNLITITIRDEDLTDADTQQTLNLFTLPAGAVLEHLIIRTTEQPAGTGLTALSIDLGHDAGASAFASAYNGNVVPSGTTFSNFGPQDAVNFSTARTVTATFTSAGCNLADLTAGEWKIYYRTAST